MREAHDLLARLRVLGATGSPGVVASIVAVEGSAYRREGARMLIEPDGALTGVLSGGCVERELLAPAHEVLADGVARTVRFDLADDEDAIWGFGLGCAGVVTVLLEPLASCGETLERAYSSALDERRETRLRTRLTPRDGGAVLVERSVDDDSGELAAPRTALPAGGLELEERLLPPVHLVVCGAERDVDPLLRLAGELGWAPLVFDSRPTARAQTRVTPFARYAGGAPRELGRHVVLDARSAVLVATHRYLDDLALLGELVGAPAGYLGLLGPARRRQRLLADLGRQRGAAIAAWGAQLRGPAGLDLGGRSPHAIALAVAAEIQAALHEGDARALADKSAPPSGEAPR